MAAEFLSILRAAPEVISTGARPIFLTSEAATLGPALIAAGTALAVVGTNPRDTMLRSYDREWLRYTQTPAYRFEQSCHQSHYGSKIAFELYTLGFSPNSLHEKLDSRGLQLTYYLVFEITKKAEETEDPEDLLDEFFRRIEILDQRGWTAAYIQLFVAATLILVPELIEIFLAENPDWEEWLETVISGPLQTEGPENEDDDGDESWQETIAVPSDYAEDFYAQTAKRTEELIHENPNSELYEDLTTLEEPSPLGPSYHGVAQASTQGGPPLPEDWLDGPPPGSADDEGPVEIGGDDLEMIDDSAAADGSNPDAGFPELPIDTGSFRHVAAATNPEVREDLRKTQLLGGQDQNTLRNPFGHYTITEALQIILRANLNGIALFETNLDTVSGDRQTYLEGLAAESLYAAYQRFSSYLAAIRNLAIAVVALRLLNRLQEADAVIGDLILHTRTILNTPEMQSPITIGVVIGIHYGLALYHQSYGNYGEAMIEFLIVDDYDTRMKPRQYPGCRDQEVPQSYIATNNAAGDQDFYALRYLRESARTADRNREIRLAIILYRYTRLDLLEILEDLEREIYEGRSTGLEKRIQIEIRRIDRRLAELAPSKGP